MNTVNQKLLCQILFSLYALVGIVLCFQCTVGAGVSAGDAQDRVKDHEKQKNANACNSKYLLTTQMLKKTPSNLMTLGMLSNKGDLCETSFLLALLEPEISTTGLKIFVSSANYNGNLGGTSGADNKCNNDSARPSTAKAYKALLFGSSALTSGTKYYNTNGYLIGTANSGSDFSGDLISAISSSSQYVWYGDGYSSCNYWTSSSSYDYGYSGLSSGKSRSSSYGNESWNRQYVGECNRQNYLYCVEQATGTPGTGLDSSEKYLFVSASTYTGDLGGKTGADTKCNSDSNRPDTSKTYKAYLYDSSSSSMTLGASKSYKNASGTIIGTTNSSGYLTLTTSINSTGYSVWSGSSSWNCNSWTSTSGSGYVGDSSSTGSSHVLSTTWTCSNFFRLYCYEQ